MCRNILLRFIQHTERAKVLFLFWSRSHSLADSHHRLHGGDLSLSRPGLGRLKALCGGSGSCRVEGLGLCWRSRTLFWRHNQTKPVLNNIQWQRHISPFNVSVCMRTLWAALFISQTLNAAAKGFYMSGDFLHEQSVCFPRRFPFFFFKQHNIDLTIFSYICCDIHIHLSCYQMTILHSSFLIFLKFYHNLLLAEGSVSSAYREMENMEERNFPFLAESFQLILWNLSCQFFRRSLESQHRPSPSRRDVIILVYARDSRRFMSQGRNTLHCFYRIK